ncbi:MAG: AAA-like domain-containing protein [Synechococcales bacterium]|nr:AAA-like domain-containing protein [Synechococcales bacterium]
MDVSQALELVDRWLYEDSGKRLNDLERQVFVGSWQGHTYEAIYPDNPEYVEKSVGYKLWQKLTKLSGEKVTKKTVHGFVARLAQRQTNHPYQKASLVLTTTDRANFRNVLISHRQGLGDSLVQALHQTLTQAGYQVTHTNPDAYPELSDQAWLAHVATAIQQCDYLIVLLSPTAAVSELVLEELQQVHRRSHPMVLPIRVQCPSTLSLNTDLLTYLGVLPHVCWEQEADTPGVLQAVLAQMQSPDAVRASSASPLAVVTPDASVGPPVPTADPELPQGQVRLDSAFYIERQPAEAQCYRAIGQPGTLIRIKAPRQMGKTSLMSRILSQAREQGYQTVPLSFQHADADIFASLNQFLQWFCSRLARRLHLLQSVEDYWSDTFGSKDNCTAYFEDCVLSVLETPLVVALDEVDRIFQHPTIADDFFGLLRAWYEEAGYGDSGSGLWEKLRLVIVHSTEVYIPLDVNQSPFNVGLPIELTEFSLEQVMELADRHHLAWQPTDGMALMQIVGGHPYLVRLALYHLAQQSLNLTDLLATAATESGIYADHLRRHLWNLQQHPSLATAFSQVVRAKEPIELDSIPAFKLHSLGLVQMQGNQVVSRFELYRQYFQDRLHES